jgi:flagellin
MGLRIATNVASLQVQNNLQEVSEKTTDQLEKLSSGRRINSAGDDAAGLAIGTKLDAETRSLRQAARNGNDGISFVQTAEGGLNEISSILIRLRELGVQAGSDTVGEQEREFLDLEYKQLLTEVDRISNSTQFNGKFLLNGEESEDLDFHVGAFKGDHNKITFEASATNSTTSGLGVDGSSINTKSDALDSLETVDAAIMELSAQRATLGSIQKRLQHSVSSIGTQVINQDAAKSRIMDSDIAESSSQLASANIIKQAGISALAQANALPYASTKLIG